MLFNDAYKFAVVVALSFNVYKWQCSTTSITKTVVCTILTIRSLAANQSSHEVVAAGFLYR